MVKINVNDEKTILPWTFLIPEKTNHWNIFKNYDNIVETYFWKMIEEKSGVTELTFKICNTILEIRIIKNRNK